MTAHTHIRGRTPALRQVLSWASQNKWRKAVVGLVVVAMTGTGVATAAIQMADTNAPKLRYSLSSDRANSLALSKATVKGTIYVVLAGDQTKISSVTFRLDDPLGDKPSIRTELVVPYDFSGGAADGSSNPLDTITLANGQHSILAEVKFIDGSVKDVYSRFTVANSGAVPVTTTTIASATSTTSATPAPTSTTVKPTPTTATPAPSGGKPTASNTGVPAGTALTVVNGNKTYSTDGQVISGLDIHGSVTVTGRNITIKNSIIRGNNVGCTTNSAVLWTRSENTIVQDTEIAASTPSACIDGVWATNVTLLRVNIRNVVDGVKAFDNTTIQDSYIHDLAEFANDPNQGGGSTHNDAVQTYEANSNIKMIHNFLDAGRNGNAAYQLTDDSRKPANNIVISQNWLSGGGCTLNLANKYGTSMTNVSVTNNRFLRTQFYAGCVIKMSRNIGITVSGNVWDDNNQPAPAPQYF